MKRLIMINILLIIALNILPKEKVVEAKKEIVIEQTISSRSLDAKREENAPCEIQEAYMPVTEISEEGKEFIKSFERLH